MHSFAYCRRIHVQQTVGFRPGTVLVGDMVTCPLCKPGVFPIVEGQGNMLADGRPVALEGHSTACGAKLMRVRPVPTQQRLLTHNHQKSSRIPALENL